MRAPTPGGDEDRHRDPRATASTTRPARRQPARGSADAVSGARRPPVSCISAPAATDRWWCCCTTLSPPALVTLIAEFLTELDLHHIILVCNDWGGAQLAISPGGTDRVANLVLVSSEAFDNLTPGVPGRLLRLTQRCPAACSRCCGRRLSPRAAPGRAKAGWRISRARSRSRNRSGA